MAFRHEQSTLQKLRIGYLSNDFHEHLRARYLRARIGHTATKTGFAFLGRPRLAPQVCLLATLVLPSLFRIPATDRIMLAIASR